jgi:mannose-6-phosphate isomerase-like protein (cupin superfamily)
MHHSVNLHEAFELFTETRAPKIVGELNDQHIKLVKLIEDKCPWHAHEQQDEMFLVLEGVIDIQSRDGTVTVRPGEFYIVRRGIEHRVIPHGDVKHILFEPMSTQQFA